VDVSIIGTAFYVMEFVKGRIITDPLLGELSKEDRRKAWFSLVETLAWLHSIDPDKIGLDGYGKKEGFYKRQCSTFERIESQQAKVKDAKTGKELGRAHDRFDEILAFVRRNLPGERFAIVHGDYKFDNVILHETEPRVIAILDWELSTVGHPLLDTVYCVGPFWNTQTSTGHPGGASRESPFAAENRKSSGMPDPDELMDRYAQIAGFDPRRDGGGRDWEVAKVFHFIRGGTISHGIQARTISGQASSEFSHVYFDNTRRSLEAALKKVDELKAQGAERSKL
jgi:aminoglycoside phosphotransferase (APT) family kinase protein